jgi:hypothetical protein
MSSNGLVLFFVTSLTALFVPSTAVVPVFVLALGLAFALSAGRPGLRALLSALLSVIPLVLFLAVVWIGIVGHAPDATLFYRPDALASAWDAVAAISVRLFLLALFTFSAVQVGSKQRLSFVVGLALPRPAKVILLAAASFADVMTQGSRRAHTALVAANVLTPRISTRNFRHGWLLLRTTWVAAVGIAAERLDTKWAYENLPNDAPIQRPINAGLTWRDLAWLAAAVGALIATAARLNR